MTKINFKYVGPFEAPKIQTAGSAGLDLFNNQTIPVTIQPGTSEKMPTGFSLEIPKNYVGIVAARSSLGFKYDCTLSNSIGVIDSDYRGEVGIKIFNHSKKPLVIQPGERVCQLMIIPCLIPEYIQVDELDETERGTGGFGSTGKK